YQVSSMELTDATRASLEDAGKDAQKSGMKVEIGGDALQVMPHTGTAEIIGVVIAAIVLVITFGSLVAAGLPLVTALVGVGIGVSTITELAEGREREEAAGRAVGTAGSAVVFAGLTVVIALVGLAVVNIPMLTKMGFAAAGTVAIAVLIALTLVPAALGFAGKRVMGRKARKAAEAEKSPEAKPNMGTRWARFVLRKPVWVMLVGVLGLGIIAVPAASLEMGLPDDGAQPKSTTQRQAYDMLSDGFGPGFNGPLLVVVDTKNSSDGKAAADRVSEEIEAIGVGAVIPPAFNKAGDTATITVIPKDRPSSHATEEVVHSIRDAGADVKADTGAEVLVTGATAM
ncbi:MMPL family transporter, partial [Streptomyces sp. NPDC047980]|uniref:MMPL family transporter n=1 Tax=Streptomyces sp. NPDC047980 TaxID=3365494 RepID=UPI00371135D6